MTYAQTETAWNLSAPESYVLLHRLNVDGSKAFKFGVLELVTRNALAVVNVEGRGLLGRRTQTPVLVEGSSGRVGDDRALGAIWELYRQQPQEMFADGTVGVKVENLARAASREYSPLKQYVDKVVLPALIERGLYRIERVKILWIFPTDRYRLTAEGEAAKADLEARMELAERELAGWVRDDPRRAMGFAALAGASLLLMPALYPDLQLLGDRLRQPDTSGGDTSGAGASGGGASDDEYETEPDALPAVGDDRPEFELGSFDLGGLDLGGMASLDFGAFDGIGDAFSAIDSGVDSGGGDGGGDGGGGDGGGGGGD